ncbi:MAG: hypothetical protein ACR2NN_15845 [Bryobacteraceae bacterium]
MGGRLAVGCSIFVLTLLGFFVFPGHTYLQSDTQIYVPMIEHIWDPSTFPQDLVATKPHLSYTLYDEISIALRWVTRASVQSVLTTQQLLFRALQILGIYLLASAFPLARWMALLVAAICSLGATIVGPAILTIEYEPVPRGFALGLVMLAIGLAARERPMWASVIASAAFLYHAPTTLPFWIVFGFVTLRRKDYKILAPLLCAGLLLFAASRFQAGVAEHQAFFFRIDPEFEKLQRMRASYNWVSTWIGSLAWRYLFYWIAGLLAFWRVRPQGGQQFLLGLPLIGVLSVPISFVLLENFKWGFIPQFQPARALLFVTSFAGILSAAAGVHAAQRRRVVEAVLWFAFVFVIPMQDRIENFLRPRTFLVIGLALCTALAVAFRRQILVLVVLAAFVLPPTFGQVHNYSNLEDSGVSDLARFLGKRTPKDAMLLFADAGGALYPGIVRARSLRSVYVDWKSGGQVNYYRSLGEEWWSRWRAANALAFRPADFLRLPALGVDYVILTRASRMPSPAPVYQNSRFVVYRVQE